MLNLGILIGLLTLFYLLGKSADLVISNIRIIAEKLGIKIFFIGLLLGGFTSLPELAVGINTVVDDISSISFGNLTGGLIVLFGLVLGTSVYLNKKIESTEKISSLIVIFAYLLLPLILGLFNLLNIVGGIILSVLYFIIIIFLYHQQKHHFLENFRVNFENGKILKNIFLLILGIVLIVGFSNLIVRLTESILVQWEISPFIIGLIIFSIGTNLPEIVVMIKSYRKKISDLSLSNLIGSGLANVLIVGFLIIIKPLEINITPAYLTLLFFSAITYVLVIIFYKSGKSLDYQEGFILILTYLLFLVLQGYFLFLPLPFTFNYIN